MSNSVVNQSATAGIVDELVKRLGALDLKISRLESDLGNAKHQRKLISGYLEQLRAPKALIRRLPNEILGMIFEHHREDQKARNAVLMRVCKLWYRIVMSTPTLWNNIILTLSTIKNLPRIWSYARFCLARGSKALLDVVLDATNFLPVHPYKSIASAYEKHYRPRYEKWHDEVIVDYLYEVEDPTDFPDFLGMYENSLLMTLAILRGREDRFLPRWRQLSVYVSRKLPYTIAYNLWNSIDGETKELTHLSFHCGSGAPEDWEQTGFPNLEGLKAFENGLELDFIRATVHLQQLRLDHSHSWTSLLHSNASRLPSLTILYLSFIPDEDFKFDGHIDLPALQALVLKGDEETFAIIPQIKAPNLTHLSLISGYHAEFTLTSCSLLNTVTDLLWACKNSLESLVQVTPILKRIHLPDGSSNKHLLEIMDIVGASMGDRSGLVHCADNCQGWPYVYPLEGEHTSLTFHTVLTKHQMTWGNCADDEESLQFGYCSISDYRLRTNSSEPNQQMHHPDCLTECLANLQLDPKDDVSKPL